uniref:CASP2 and RIPK1 domain containing adaptor with death domain n=1 Tax=Oryzias sinensis TaxID=183150 RepID=A0A8C7WWW3_9TELE
MDPAHKAVLRKLRAELCSQLMVSESIVPVLFQEGVLTHAHVEDIESEPTDTRKSQKLLDILPNRGPRAFPAFMQSLADFSWIRDRLVHELRTEPEPRINISILVVKNIELFPMNSFKLDKQKLSLLLMMQPCYFLMDV